MEEDTQPVIAPDLERSHHTSAYSVDQSSAPTSDYEPQTDDYYKGPSWKSRARTAKSAIGRPRFLAVSGGIIVTLGIILTIVGVTVTGNKGGKSPSAAASTDRDGIPLNATRPDDTPPDGISECNIHLGDWNAYRDAALHAEQELLGAAVTDISSDQLGAALRSARPLALSVVFWVATSPLYTWSDTFRDDIAAQMKVLNKGYAAADIRFTQHGIYAINATDDEVKHCDEWHKGIPLMLNQHLLGSEALLHVLVCEPEGLNGATPILGSREEEEDGSKDEYRNSGDSQQTPMVVVLRRSALWRSQTSLVHQVGHAFGLPHPFPDSDSCRFDADAIIDTPLQFRGSVGCEEDARGALCQHALDAGPASLPPFNFMDISNDSCRQVFSIGQVLRMRSMLFKYRPQLYQQASLGYQLTPLPLVSGFQSALPSKSLLLKQIAAAEATYNSDDDGDDDNNNQNGDRNNVEKSGMLKTVQAESLGRLTDALEHAKYAASQNTLSLMSMDVCSCVGPDSTGQVFWTGVFDGAYGVDAVSISQPWQVFFNAGERTSSSSTTTTIPTKPNEAAVLPDIEIDVNDDSELAAAAASVALAATTTNPSNETLPTSPLPGADVLDDENLTLWEMVGHPLIEVRIGYSANHQLNVPCTSEPVQLVSPLQLVHCNQTLSGRFVTVALVKRQLAPSTPSQEQEGQALQMCLCKVTPFSYISSSALKIQPGRVSLMSGGVLDISSSAVAVQSSTIVAASVAYMPSSASASMSTSNLEQSSMTSSLSSSSDGDRSSVSFSGVTGFTFQNCSLTEPEEAPWWSLRLGLDPWNVGGLRFQMPFSCPNLTAVDGGCGPGTPYNLDVYVTDETINPIKGSLGFSESDTCAAGVAVDAGRWVDIDCGQVMTGRVITLAARKIVSQSSALEPAPETTSATPSATTSAGSLQSLSLCGLQVIGSYQLPLAESMSSQLSWHKTQPPELMSGFTLPIDNDLSSCIRATESSPSGAYTAGNTSKSTSNPGSSTTTPGSTLWQLALRKIPIVHAVQVSTSGSKPVVSLLNTLGSPGWSSALASASRSASDTSSDGGGMILYLDQPAAATAITVTNFSSLCDVQLFVESAIVKFGAPDMESAATSMPPSTTTTTTTTSMSTSTMGPLVVSNDGSWQAAAVDQEETSIAEAIDGDYRTCAVIKAPENGLPVLRIDLTQAHRILRVYLVTDQVYSNVSIAILPEDQQRQQSTSSKPNDLWSSALSCKSPTSPDSPVVQVLPWTEIVVDCPLEEGILAKTVLVQGGLEEGLTQQGLQGKEFRVCEVRLEGQVEWIRE